MRVELGAAGSAEGWLQATPGGGAALSAQPPHLLPGAGAGLAAYCPPPRVAAYAPTSAEGVREALVRAHLTPRIGVEGVVAGLFPTTWRLSPLWAEPMPPVAALQLGLPCPSGRPDVLSVTEERLPSELPSAEVHAAAPGSRQHTRGRVGAPIFKPGGGSFTEPGGEPEDAGTADTAAVAAGWLAELEAGGLHSALPPGFKFSAFGATRAAAPCGGEGEEGGEDSGGLGGEGGATASAPEAAAAAARPREPPGQLKIDNIFADVWMMEGEEEEEEEEGGEDAGEIAEAAAESVPGQAAAAAGGGAAGAGRGGAEEPASAEVGGAAPEDGGSPALDALVGGAAEEFWGALQRQSKRKRPKFVSPADAEWAVVNKRSPEQVSADFSRLKSNLAMQWPFELDTFQKDAICRMEDGQSVFVAAHTSAGKTVVAEYALALATKHCTRTVYTSPIKTISNQKFRDFSQKFEVGLLTGDVQIKPESPCLIMTTEILRSMLYKGADIIRDIEWVIFDEVHYVNDAERGVVWEEVIIMLPAHVNIILLSATVPNVMEFADWVGRTKRKQIHVTGTTRRPVPLEHHVFFNSSLFRVCAGEVFDRGGLKQAAASKAKKDAPPTTTKELKAARPTGRGDGGAGRAGRGGRGAPAGRRGGGSSGGSFGGRGGSGGGGMKSEKSQMSELIHILKKKELLPVAVFCFSKKRIDASADGLSAMDLTVASEKSEIHVFCERCLSRLKGTDKALPQVLRVREMLKRGIGVHHAGLLPIMKEVVEMLFCRGLIKVLFATETFAMGVNAPTRTVVFHSTRKHDGKSFRSLLPGEYTQMAGRAGRRGLDTTGTVIIAAWEELPDESELSKMLTGKATRLESRFRLTYSMILNLLRVEDLKVEDMMKRSFAEFHAQKALPDALNMLSLGEAHLRALEGRPWPLCYLGCSREAVLEYAATCAEIAALTARLQDAIMGTKAAQSALVAGRLVQLQNRKTGLPEVGVVCGVPKEAASAARAAPSSDKQLYILRLHRRSPLDKQGGDKAGASGGDAVGLGPADAVAGGPPAGDDDFFQGLALRPKAGGGRRGDGPTLQLPQEGDIGEAHYVLDAMPASELLGIGRTKIKLDGDKVLEGDKRSVADAVTQLQRAQEEAVKQEGDLPLMDPLSDLKLNDIELVGTVHARQRLIEARAAMPCHKCPQLPEQFCLMNSIRLLTARLHKIKHQISDANLQQMPEFHQRVAVLQDMGYVDEDHTVQLKGRVACEVNTGDELLSTEIIFAGLLTDLSPAEAVALLSALVFQEKSDVEPSLPERLLEAKQRTEFASGTLRFGLMEVVYEWARGTEFKAICELTDIMEGSIVRTIVRLEETCREFRDAARVMGNMQLFHQMEEASAIIKRDVIFAGSLYLS
eukprot:jgi/Tetstr1/460678/TSEL_005874.t1